MRERRTHGSVRGLRREPLVYSTIGVDAEEALYNAVDYCEQDTELGNSAAQYRMYEFK